MDTVPATRLYATEPHLQRLSRALRSTVSALGTFYWAVFQVWGYFFLGSLAIVLIISGIYEFSLAPARWYLALPGIGFGMAFFLSARFRRFAWAAFGFGIVWFVIVTAALAPFLDVSKRIESPVLLAVVLALYCLPPLIGAALSGHAKRRRA